MEKWIRTMHHRPFSIVAVPILGFLWQPTQWPRFSQLIQNRLGRETRPKAIEFGCHMAEMAWSVWYLKAQSLRPNCTGVLWKRKRDALAERRIRCSQDHGLSTQSLMKASGGRFAWWTCDRLIKKQLQLSTARPKKNNAQMRVQMELYGKYDVYIVYYIYIYIVYTDCRFFSATFACCCCCCFFFCWCRVLFFCRCRCRFRCGCRCRWRCRWRWCWRCRRCCCCCCCCTPAVTEGTLKTSPFPEHGLALCE